MIDQYQPDELAMKFTASLQALAADVSERLPLASIATGFLSAGVSISLAQSGRTATAEWLRAIADECEALPDTRGTMGRA